MVGKIISHYEILEKLGSGGMGVVYKAEDIKLKRTVALKFLPPDLIRDDEARERFLHEAQAASRFDHPNICTIYEIDETPDGQTFIVMAHLEGETLKQKIAVGATGGSPLPVDEALEIANQILQGLSKAHSEGIIHRDIKPANLMVTNDGIVKILDFGLAKLTGVTQLTKSGMTLGTVAYMSPEQTRGENVDHRSDLWSLGVVLYQMLTGEPPFKGDYEQAIVYSIMSDEPAPITNEIATELQQIVGKALEKDRDERYQGAEEMLTDLQAFRDGTKLQIAKSKGRPTARKRSLSFGGLAVLLVALIIGFLMFQPSKPPTADKIRLAVLPFDNITQNPEEEYFADGITDEMIARLSRVSGFGVIARTSVMQYKTNPKSISEIARELSVSKILEGSVRKTADKLLIRVQLVDVESQESVWSTDYDREFADVFAIQSEVALQVASALRVELSATERRQIEKRGTENLEAYNLYLQGHYYANKYTPESLNEATEYFNKAVELDSGFAPAYAGLARCYSLAANAAFLPAMESYPKARAYAIRALEIDHTLAEAHAQLAGIMHRFDWDWAGAERELKKAREFNPDEHYAVVFYATLLSAVGRHAEAINEARRAREFDPVSLSSQQSLGIALFFARRYDEAIEQFSNLMAMDPNYGSVYFWLTLTYVEKGMHEEALEAIERYGQLIRSGVAVAFQGHVHARAGRRGAARKIAEQLAQFSKQRYIPASLIANIYSSLGETALAMEWLERAYEQHDPQLFRINIWPSFDPVRAEPRFSALLKKMGLED